MLDFRDFAELVVEHRLPAPRDGEPLREPRRAGRSTSNSAVAAEVAEAGVAVVTLPQTNLFLQGRDHATATPRGLTALRPLLEAGVTVAGGADNLQDPFNTMGRAIRSRPPRCSSWPATSFPTRPTTP